MVYSVAGGGAAIGNDVPLVEEGDLVAHPWLHPGCVCNSFLHTFCSLQEQYLQVGLWSSQIIWSGWLLSLCDLGE